MESLDSKKMNIQKATPIKTIASKPRGINTPHTYENSQNCFFPDDLTYVEGDGQFEAKEDIADNRKLNLENADCVVNELDGNDYCASGDSIISVKEEALKEVELDIKEDPSDIRKIVHGCEINLVQTKLEPTDDGSIEENQNSINPDGPRSHVKVEGGTTLENPSTAECVIKAMSPKDSFATCNHCLKAFYRGFTYDKILKPRMGKPTSYKCSERNRGCCAEVCVFLKSKFFMEVESHHTCTPQEGNPPLIFNELSLTAQRCASSQPRTVYRHDVLTRYVPLKKVVSWRDRDTIADIDPGEATTIAYNIVGARTTLAVYMGYEYKVQKKPTYWSLTCADTNCPGLLRVLSPNTAVAKIADHTCDANTDSVDVDVPFSGHPPFKGHPKDQLFGDQSPDIPDDALAYYCKFVSGYRRNAVLYKRHHYLYSTWNIRHYVWKCEHPSCHAALKIFKNNKAVLLVGDHSCENLSPATELEKNYHLVKVPEYAYYDVNYVDSQEGELPLMDFNDAGMAVYYYKIIDGVRRKVMYYMGYKYVFCKWGQFYSCWSCLEESCSATIKILNGTRGIMAVDQHTCDQLELGNVTIKTEVTDTVPINDRTVTAKLTKLKVTKAPSPCENERVDKNIPKTLIQLESDGKQYIYHLGYLYKFIMDKDNVLSCIHQDAFGCRAQLNLSARSGLHMPTPEHNNCFRRSRNVENLMFFQRVNVPGEYAYFSGHVYKRRSKMMYELHHVYKWVCAKVGCEGVLTTKFNEVVAESTHGCRTDEEGPVEAECIVLSDDSDGESARKKIKTE